MTLDFRQNVKVNKVVSMTIANPVGWTSRMVCKLGLQEFMSKFESHWVSHSYRLVLHLSKKLSRLLLEHLR